MIHHSVLPAVNACLNAASAAFLLAGYFFIRRKAVERHRACMLGAFACSTIFLASYLYYHAHEPLHRFPGAGLARAAYLAILGSHTVLAVGVVPLALATLALAARGRFDRHAIWARRTLPLWLYVSVTGVVIYAMLYVVPWPTR